MSSSKRSEDKPKAIAYVRVSTITQVERDSIQNQVMDVNKLADFKGFEIVQWFEDAAVSRTKDERQGLARAMEYLRNNRGTVAAFLASKIDRVGISNVHLAKIAEEMVEMNVKFITLDFDVDLESPSGRLTFDILAAMAKFEIGRMKERIRSGLARARAEGKKLGRKKKKIAKKDLEDMLNDKASIAYMARKLKVSSDTIIARLDEFGLRRKEPL